MKRMVCLWLPRWPLQRLAAARAELRGRPVLLYEARHGGLKVVDFAPELGAGPAAPRGIRPGMPLAEALALAGAAAGGLHLEPYDPAVDLEALRQLAQRWERFSPTVGLEQAARPESLLLDVTGLASLFGSEQALAEQMRCELAERGLSGRIALADTLGAAWAVAHFAIAQSGGSGGQARPLNDVEATSHSALLFIPPGHTWSALARLSTAALRLPEETVACLAELGIERIEQLAALPRSALLSRFGPQLLVRLDQAFGVAAEALVGHRPPPEWQARRLLEHATNRRETIELVCGQLLGSLTEALAARRYGAMQVALRFESQGGEPLELSLGLYRPSDSASHLLELVRLRLERLRLSEPVCAVQVAVTATAPLALVQQSLLDEPAGQTDGRALANLVDRLTSRLGRAAVTGPWLLSEAQPEYACHYAPLAGAEPSGGQAAGRRAARGRRAAVPPRMRPLHLVHPPEPLRAVSAAPDGPPVRFCWRGVEHRVGRAWGPERIETGWWRARGAQRDYYRVETATGQRYWLFRHLPDGRWYLHGEFD